MENLCRDINGLVDHLGYKNKKFIVIGHDWSGWLAWRYVQSFPERVRAVGVLCTAYTPPNKTYVSTEKLAQIYPNWMYQVFFNHPTAEAQIMKSLELYFTITLRGAKDGSHLLMSKQQYTPDTWSLSGKTSSEINLPRSVMISQIELDNYVKAYTKSGMNGGLNWYRVRHLNFEQEAKLKPEIGVKALMVTAGRDPALSELGWRQ